MILEPTGYLSNIEKLQELFRLSYGREISEEYLIWRYVDNPLLSTFAAVEFAEDKIVSSYTASPCCLSYGGETLKTALSATTMTHPDYRGLGLFPQLADQVYKQMGQSGFEVIWGFPNPLSHPVFLSKLQWFDIAAVPTMTLKVSNRAQNERMNYTTDNDFALGYGGVSFPEAPIAVIKSQAYLQWRYREHPTNSYANIIVSNKQGITSHVVLKIYNNTLDIVDMRAATREEAEYLLESAVSYAVENKLQTIQGWAPIHHFIYSLYKKAGFEAGSPVFNFGGRLLVNRLNKNDFADYSRWYVQMGDSDVF